MDMKGGSAWRCIVNIVLTLLIVQYVVADPETVDGLYLTKKSSPVKPSVPSSNQLGGPPVWPPNVGAPGTLPLSHASGRDVGKFVPGHLGQDSHHRRAFDKFLPKTQPYLVQQNNPTGPVNRLQQQTNQFAQPLQSPGLNPGLGVPNALVPAFPNHPVMKWPRPQSFGNRMSQQPQFPRTQAIRMKQPSSVTLSTIQQAFHSSPSPQRNVPQEPEATKPGPSNFLNALQTSTLTPQAIPTLPAETTQNKEDLNQLNSPKGEQEVSPRVVTKPPQAKKELETSSGYNQNTIEPKSSYIKDIRSRTEFEPFGLGSRTDAFSGGDRHKAIVGLVIGIVFVAVFVAMGVGLAAQCVVDKINLTKTHALFGNMRSPNADDETPPELRGNGHPTFGPPSSYERGHLLRHDERNAKVTHGNLNQPLFTGKLILHDPPGLSSSALCRTTAAAANKMTNTLFAAQQAIIMPSPAEQVTHDLVSPKYDTDDCTEDEDDSDDTVYECPGLAANTTAMEEMVVRNPFYLQGGELGLMPTVTTPSEPKPISSQSSIFHHGIKGAN